ncbi:MAG: hypothetical protein Q4G58_07550 [bacterium]|nr:hypothetical protein [bacterium]
MREDIYISKANKLLVPLFAICSVMITGMLLLVGLLQAMSFGILAFILNAIIWLVIKKWNKVEWSSYLLPMIFFWGVYGYTLTSGGGSFVIFEFAMICFFSLLYADRKAFISLAALEDILIVFTEYVIGISLLGEINHSIVPIMHLFILIVIQVLGATVIKWIRASELEIVHSKEDALKTVEIVKASGKSLEEEVELLEGSTNTTNVKSGRVFEAMDEIRKGAEVQVSQMVEISQTIMGITNQVKSTIEFCDHLSNVSVSLVDVTEHNKLEINNMEQNVGEIQTGMKTAKTTVHEFTENMSEIMGVLTGIKQISAQINLLALNASI